MDTGRTNRIEGNPGKNETPQEKMLSMKIHGEVMLNTDKERVCPVDEKSPIITCKECRNALARKGNHKWYIINKVRTVV